MSESIGLNTKTIGGLQMSAKKRINSKQKGSEYERKIAKILSKWWGEPFHRTPMSGGLHWREDNRVAGDIVTPPNSVYPWCTECKKRNEWHLEQLLKSTGDVEKWWKQAVTDSERVGLRPLLIFSKNFAPDYLMMKYDEFNEIVDDPQFNYFVVSVSGKEPRIVCLLDDFVKFVSKDDVIRALGL